MNYLVMKQNVLIMHILQKAKCQLFQYNILLELDEDLEGIHFFITCTFWWT